MNSQSEKDQDVVDGLVRSIRRLGLMVAFLIITTIAMTVMAILQPDLSSWYTKSEKQIAAEKQRIQDYQDWQDDIKKKKQLDSCWKPVSITSLPINSELRKQVEYGSELIMHTSKYLGPKGSVMQMSNGMNCQNCHLEAGTKAWGNNYGAVFATYPKYRARSGTEEDIYKRINDCFERSLNGTALPKESKEMQAIKSYIEFIGKDAPKGEKPKGSGIVDLPFLDRPANPVKGKELFVAKCQSCHQANGEGLMNTAGNEYTYPPLWGENSYNIGAGLYRLSRFAGFIKNNMPQGADFQNQLLTNEEAWDIAAFVNSQPRPGKDLSGDWPNINEKPVDHPFGPYADPFQEEQHKFGPFKPIAELKKKNQTK